MYYYTLNVYKIVDSEIIEDFEEKQDVINKLFSFFPACNNYINQFNVKQWHFKPVFKEFSLLNPDYLIDLTQHEYDGILYVLRYLICNGNRTFDYAEILFPKINLKNLNIK